jgi:3-dehydrosphinganine reductase
MFNNQHIVITGGSSGLGLELARLLAAEGARLTLVARNLSKLEEAASALRQQVSGAKITVLAVDVCNEQAISRAMQQIAEQGQGIDMLINSAGILREGYFEKLAAEDFREVMEINYFGLLNATRAALPFLQQSRGRLVNIASIAGLTGAFGYTSYCASKHALVGLSDTLRYELQPKGIRVHLVCPGEFDSPMVDELDKARTPENRAHAQTIPKAGVEPIARDTLAGIRAGKYLIIPTFPARLVAFAIRHFPRLVRALGDRTIRSAQRSRN